MRASSGVALVWYWCGVGLASADRVPVVVRIPAGTRKSQVRPAERQRAPTKKKKTLPRQLSKRTINTFTVLFLGPSGGTKNETAKS